MTDVFLELLNRSISASYLVLAVLLVRPLLKKAPKWMMVLLWGIVAVRLLCPVSLESALSLIPSAQTIPPTITVDATPQIQSGIPALNAAVNPMLSGSNPPMPTASATPLQITFGLLSDLWAIGAGLMLLYSLGSYWNLRWKLSTAVRLRDNIFQSEQVESPFVLGLLNPRIYLPFDMAEENRDFVIAHERSHIRRKDHWWKPLGFFLLSLHWFNPVMWLAYWLLSRDIELACDEAVIDQLDQDQKADYSQALLWCSLGRRQRLLCPLAFGEVSVAQRVKSILHYKKPGLWVCLTSVALCVAVAVCFLTNPSRDNFEISFTVPAGSQAQYVYATEEISPTGNTITLSGGETLPDTEFILESLDSGIRYGPNYLTPGMPVTVTVEPGWYRVGVNVQNSETEEDSFTVYVEGVQVRISEYDPFFCNVQYTVSAVVYENPRDSYSNRTEFYMPSYFLGNGLTLYSILGSDWESLGAMEPFVLTQENFDCLIHETGDAQWLEVESASDIRRDNQAAWKLLYGKDQLYYVLQQQSGGLYLASGYYDFDEAGDPDSDDTTIQRIFRLEPSVRLAEATLWADVTVNGGSQSITHPAFPDVRFTYDDTKVTATAEGVTKVLFTGMPIDNVYFADLTGDGYPELCATVAFGSGLIDSRVIVYDYAADTTLTLQNRGTYDYRLSLADGHLIVTEYEYGTGLAVERGYLTKAHDAIQLLPMATEDTAQVEENPDLEDYRTDYIGDVSNVTKIAQLLPYPTGYRYDSIEIYSDQEPYELTVYLLRTGEVDSPDFARCAELVFEYIGNADFVTFRNRMDGAVLDSYARYSAQRNRYRLTIGDDNVTQLMLVTAAGETSTMTGEYRKGQRVWLEPLEGLQDIEVLTITALDAQGERVWQAQALKNPELQQGRHASGDWELVDGANRQYPLADIPDPVMVPTEADLEGMVDQYLFLPLDGATYRYQRSDVNPSALTPSALLHTVREEAQPQDIIWQVYGTREYPGNQTLYVTGSDGSTFLYEYSPSRRCAEGALEEAKRNGVIVVENGVCTSGLDKWELFCRTTEKGRTDQVTFAYYYTLDESNVAPELYAATREDYPSLTYATVSYWDDTYHINYGGDQKEYPYLLFYPDLSTGGTNPPGRYVLTTDKTATLDELFQSMASSLLGAYIDHFTLLKTPKT